MKDYLLPLLIPKQGDDAARKTARLSLAILGLLILAGILYGFLRVVSFSHAWIRYETQNKRDSAQRPIRLPFRKRGTAPGNPQYTVRIHSRIPQTVVLHVVVDDELHGLRLNRRTVDLGPLRRRYHQKQLRDWQTGYVIPLSLRAGNNRLHIISRDYGVGHSLRLAQAPQLVDYLVALLCFAFPVLLLILRILLRVLAWRPRLQRIRWPLLLLLTGILLRAGFVLSYGYASYNHDHGRHVEYIKYVARRGSLPQPDKGVEYPQQPLYYLFGGGTYALLTGLGLADQYVLQVLVWISVLLSVLFLMVGYRFAGLITDNRQIRTWIMGFLALTPSFVFIAGRINNDALALPLCALAALSFARFFRENDHRSLLATLVWALLALFSKLSAGIWLGLLFCFLIWQYRRRLSETVPERSTRLRQTALRLLLVSLVGVFAAGLIASRAWLPATRELRIVNSGRIAGLTLDKTDLPYFLSFRIGDLISLGQSWSLEKNNQQVRTSFPSYLYGTMFFGEYNYSRMARSRPLFRILMQGCYLLGLMLPLALLGFLIMFKRQLLLLRVLFWSALAALFSVAWFVLRYPSVCNTDFRYLIPVLPVIAALIASGLESVRARLPKGGRILSGALVLLFVLEGIWLVWLILLRMPNSIS